MSKKNLLNESTVRQFMKYANIGGLTQGFVNETYGMKEEVVEEAAYNENEYVEDEEGIEDMGADVPVDDMDLDMEPEAEVDDTSEASVEALVDALADTITRVTGVEVSAAEDAPPVDDAAEMDMDEPPGDDFDAAEDEEVLDEAPIEERGPGGRGPAAGGAGKGGTHQSAMAFKDSREAAMDEETALDEEAMIEETVRRVTKKIAAMRKRDQMAETITNRIMERLTSKK